MQEESGFINPVKRKLLFEEVADELKRLILDGQIAPGTKLPSEHDLADQFGVSRNVVREGVRSLIGIGLVTVRPGSGVYVQAPSRSTVTSAFSRYLTLNRDPDWLAQLYEVRGILEPGIAALAAERATEKHLADLDRALEEMRAHTDEPHRWAEADWGFHRALARAADNHLFMVLLNPLYEQIIVAFEEGLRYPGAFQSGLDYHARIIGYLRARDPEAAKITMLAHLKQSHLEVSEALGQNVTTREPPQPETGSS